MSNKKSEETEKSAELQELEHRVDVMMSTELSDKPAPKTLPVTKKTSSLRIISDYDDSRKTAPELSPKLLKHIKTDEPEPSPEPEPKPATKEPEPTPEMAPEAPAPAAPAAAEAPEEPPAEPTPSQAKPAKSILEDTETDKAVDDIVVHEGDTQLAVDDAIAKHRTAEFDVQNRRGLFATIFTSYWTWLFIIGIAGVTYAWFH